MAEHDTTKKVPNEDEVIRNSAWTCRLPKDLMSNIFMMLADDKDAKSLAAVQSTSSAMYLVATPHLYLHLHIDMEHLAYLLRLFEDLSPDPLLYTQDQSKSCRHPLDLDLYHRLRWALSLVESIHLRIVQSPDVFPQDSRMFSNIGTALGVFGQLGR